MLFSHIWGKSWITSLAVEPLAQLEILACCLRGLECCCYRKWCLPREMRPAKWNPLWVFFKLQWNFSEENMWNVLLLQMFFISLEEPEMGKWWLPICAFIYSCLHIEHLPGWLDWSDCSGCLQSCSWKPAEWVGHGNHVAKLISTAVCGSKFVTLGTVKLLSSLLSAFVSLLWQYR